MSARAQLLGYRYSVYTRIVRMVRHEKGIAPEIVEIRATGGKGKIAR